MKENQIELIDKFQAVISDIFDLAKFIGKEAIPVAPIGDETFDNFFEIERPDGVEGTFAYLTYSNTLNPKTSASQFRTLFQKFDKLKELSGKTYGGQLDFLFVVGEKRLIIFDSEDPFRRLDLTKEKLDRQTTKYNDKFDKLRIKNVVKHYVEDDFGDYNLDDFKSPLFRFSIGEDKTFEIRTKKLRGELLTYITNHLSAQKIIIDNVLKEDVEGLDYSNDFHKEIISSVTDTLVLRQILVRILEGRYGYTEEKAREAVKFLGLGSSLDESISKRKNIDNDSEKEFQKIKKPKETEQMSLFESIEILDDDRSDDEIVQLREDVVDYYSNTYGGDLYVGDIADAATAIELLLTPDEWTKMWHWTSNENFDFDLSDVSPSTIGEQYEQTMGNELKNDDGYLYYVVDKKEQKGKGAYYTQEKITDYILKKTVGKYFEERIKEIESGSRVQKISLIRKLLSTKIADISSGGGTFLAGAAKLISSKYDSIIQAIDNEKIIKKYIEFETKTSWQRYVIKNMVYGIDIDLKALIVSSFALGLETLTDEIHKLPQLLGRTLIHKNSLVSAIEYKNREVFFEVYKDRILELRDLRLNFLKNQSSFPEYEEKRVKLQKLFLEEQLVSNRKLDGEVMEKFLIEVLELDLTEVFFDEEGNFTKGFDIIVGNPPYINLQNLKDEEKFLKEHYRLLGNFETYTAQTDLYALFYERSLQLLKIGGCLGYITSNKWMRSSYGGSLRKYFVEKTNPLLLVNLGGKMFNATVDTNILILKKELNQNELSAIDLTIYFKDPVKRIENMSDFVRQQSIKTIYKKDEAWTILNEIERSIKSKIEKVGRPLRDWNITINRGILTGINEAFIISKEIREELIASDQKAAEIIYPILRGRDIKRNKIDFQELYLINTHNGYLDQKGNRVPRIDIDNYPSVKRWLNSSDWNDKPDKGTSYERLEKRADQGDTPYNLRSLSYMDDF
ncbi:Eco57I restriction-modification methylase domain-containing protein, partial [Enterococcus florum]|uniref:Eco57I restriction-modification methylase domain-containing protein n=1 Tax=Enterococcus florum TaxID=2480627 RepID=UPI0011BA7866